MFDLFPHLRQSKVLFFLALLISILTYSWIMNNSGLRSDPEGWLEPARLLATFCIAFTSYVVVLTVFDQVLKHWARFRGR